MKSIYLSNLLSTSISTPKTQHPTILLLKTKNTPRKTQKITTTTGDCTCHEHDSATITSTHVRTFGGRIGTTAIELIRNYSTSLQVEPERRKELIPNVRTSFLFF
jgi:hypothetical protein